MELFSNKSSIIDLRLGYIYTSENTEIFIVKLRWRKSSRLLQCVAFLVVFESDLLLKQVMKHFIDIFFQRRTVSSKLFFGGFTNTTMTVHASSIAEYGRVPISNNFSLGSDITQYASTNYRPK